MTLALSSCLACRQQKCFVRGFKEHQGLKVTERYILAQISATEVSPHSDKSLPHSLLGVTQHLSHLA